MRGKKRVAFITGSASAIARMPVWDGQIPANLPAERRELARLLIGYLERNGDSQAEIQDVLELRLIQRQQRQQHPRGSFAKRLAKIRARQNEPLRGGLGNEPAGSPLIPWPEPSKA